MHSLYEIVYIIQVKQINIKLALDCMYPLMPKSRGIWALCHAVLNHHSLNSIIYIYMTWINQCIDNCMAYSSMAQLRSMSFFRTSCAAHFWLWMVNAETKLEVENGNGRGQTIPKGPVELTCCGQFRFRAHCWSMGQLRKDPGSHPQ